MYFNLQSNFFSVKMSNKVVESDGHVSEFYLSKSYNKHNLK